MSGLLRIAIQKSGRLSDRSIEVFAAAGLRMRKGKNELVQRAEHFPVEFMMVRDDDIPAFVASGACDLGVVGQNVLREAELGEAAPKVEIVQELGFGRCSLKIAIPKGESWAGPGGLEGRRIATSYPNLMRAYLAEQGVTADLVRLEGAVEVAPRLGLADLVCDLVSTGGTLDANGLKPVATVLDSQAVLIRSPRALSPELARLADSILTRVQGVIATQGAKYVLMNAPADRVEEITAILPGSEAPTVMPLAGQGKVAIHAVCQEAVFWETLERLKGAGASSILVLPIEKMLL